MLSMPGEVEHHTQAVNVKPVEYRTKKKCFIGKYRQCWISELAKVSKRHHWDSNRRYLGGQSGPLTTLSYDASRTDGTPILQKGVQTNNTSKEVGPTHRRTGQHPFGGGGRPRSARMDSVGGGGG